MSADIDENAAQQRAVETLVGWTSGGGVRPLGHIREPDVIYGAINAIAALLAVAVAGDDGLNDACTAKVLDGIAVLAGLGEFASGG
ncbi:MAG TPA: hypothetical protein VFX27_07615 [Sphingobium sp.]|nr:hypothetical protein [Sphingobium sp.]